METLSSSPQQGKNPDTYVGLDELVDLSVSELILLQHLLNYSEEIIRFALLQEINTYMMENKKISASSFYHSLKKLERKGLVTTTTNKKDNIVKVKATPLARKALNEISTILISGVIDVFKFSKELLQMSMEKFNLKQIEKLLIIPMNNLGDIRIIRMIIENTKETYVLSTDETFHRLQQRGLEDVIQSKISGDIIREPNDFFDAAILFNFNTPQENLGIGPEQMLNELYRVIKPGGSLFISGMKKIKKTDNFIIDRILKSLRAAQVLTEFSEKEVRDSLEKHSFMRLEKLEYEGLIIIKGTKPLTNDSSSSRHN